MRQAQNKLNETTQKMAKATAAKSDAEKAVVQHKAAVKKATAELKKSQDEKDEFIMSNPFHEYGRGLSERGRSSQAFSSSSDLRCFTSGSSMRSNFLRQE